MTGISLNCIPSNIDFHISTTPIFSKIPIQRYNKVLLLIQKIKPKRWLIIPTLRMYRYYIVKNCLFQKMMNTMIILFLSPKKVKPLGFMKIAELLGLKNHGNESLNKMAMNLLMVDYSEQRRYLIPTIMMQEQTAIKQQYNAKGFQHR